MQGKGCQCIIIIIIVIIGGGGVCLKLHVCLCKCLQTFSESVKVIRKHVAPWNLQPFGR